MLLHQSPGLHGIECTRWRLQDVGKALAWLEGCSPPGIHKVLKRFGFSRKQALYFVYSPDVEFRSKWQAVLQAFFDAANHPEQAVLLFLDELTYYRQPGKAPAYHHKGKQQPKAYQAARYNTQTRIVAVLNAWTGQVHSLQRSRIGKEALVEFYAQIRTAYPNLQRLYLVQDNWPVHKLPEVVQALQTHRLTPLFLPTYASWLNPIEKLWRWLKQKVLHNHRLAADLEALRQQVTDFLDGFKNGSDPLLRYVGLLSD